MRAVGSQSSRDRFVTPLERDRPSKRDGSTEDRVIGAVWDELGGFLSEEFRVGTVRPRRLDGLIVADKEKKLVWPEEVLPLDGKRTWAVEAKSGDIEMGVLGQALFGAELLRQLHRPAEVIPVAAAVAPPTGLLRALLDEFRPFGLDCRVYERLQPPHKPGSSKGKNPYELRKRMLGWLLREWPGQLITIEKKRHKKDFRNVRVRGSEHALSELRLSAVLLPERDRRLDSARYAEEVVRRNERVLLIHTSPDLYRGQMGRALFSAEIARRLLGLKRAVGVVLYARDNKELRSLLSRYSSVLPIKYRSKLS